MWRVLLGLWTGVVVGVTTMPWSNFKGHAHWSNIWWIPFHGDSVSFFDVIGNVLLFLPLGFFYVQSWPKRDWARFGAILYAALISVAVELFQTYSHNRIPSTTDVCSNLAGAALGAICSFWKKS